MRILEVKDFLTNKELFKKMRSQRNARDFINWQIIYSVQSNPGKLAEVYASYLGVAKSKVYKVIERYNNNGVNWDSDKKWGGRREERAYLTLPEEKSLLDSLSDDAVSGKILTYNHIKTKVEDKIGHKVSDDYIWDLFNRHSWKKKAPRPTHPDGDVEKREIFKKNSQSYWSPPH